MAGDWVGAGVSEKIELSCPNCGTLNEILWIPEQKMYYRKDATTGGSETKAMKKTEKIEGKCKECGYKFKADDME